MLVACLAVVVFLWAIWWQLYQNSVTVEPNGRERVVIQNVFSGKMRVLHQGTHFLSPSSKIMARVQANREPIEVPEEGETGSEEVRPANNVTLYMQYRYDVIYGRLYVKQQDIDDGLYPAGQLGQLLPNIRPDDVNSVNDKTVIQLVTTINYEQRLDRVRTIVESAIESEIGSYDTIELLTPNKLAPNYHTIPKVQTPAGIVPVPVTTPAEVYTQLSRCIEERANLGLSFVGINIIDFRITDLIAKDPQMIESFERETRMRLQENAAQVIHDQEIAAGTPNPMSNREALAAGGDQFGPVTIAEAIRAGTKNIADGMRNFGRGPSDKTP